MALRKDPVDPFETFGNQIRKNHLTRMDEDKLRKDIREEMNNQVKREVGFEKPKFAYKNKTNGRHKIMTNSVNVRKSTITTNPYAANRKKIELQRLIIERAKQLK